MTDPAIQVAAEALAAAERDFGSAAITMHDSAAQVAVDAYRRHVLASRPDAERIAELQTEVDSGIGDPYRADDLGFLLAALADETAARQAAEADRDRGGGFEGRCETCNGRHSDCGPA